MFFIKNFSWLGNNFVSFCMKMVYHHRLNLGYNNSNLISLSSFTVASFEEENQPLHLYCLAFSFHYLPSPFPETDAKPRASPIISYIGLLSVNVIQEPPTCFSAFNFFSYHSITWNSLYSQVSPLFIFPVSFPHPLTPALHFPQLLPHTFPESSDLPTQAAPSSPVRLSFTCCLLGWLHSALIALIPGIT